MSSDSQSSSRRWSRLLNLFLTRRRRSTPSPNPQSSTDVALPRPTRRHRNRRSAPDQTSQSHSSPVLHFSTVASRSVPVHSSDDTSEDTPPSNPAFTTTSIRRAPLTNAMPDLDAMQDNDLFAVFNRFFDDYQSGPPPDFESPATYIGRIPHNQPRHRVTFRIPSAYYNQGRIQGRRSHFATELERELELRLNVLTALRTTANASASSYDAAASDAQIEKLPTFVMEKGETRSVKQIFASMKHRTVGEEEARADECGGLMTSYTECAICLSDFEPGDEITVLPCGHFFHLTGCVREWLRNHARTCPTCRADICISSSSSETLGTPSTAITTG